jgi:hypothetical protein
MSVRVIRAPSFATYVSEHAPQNLSAVIKKLAKVPETTAENTGEKDPDIP